MNPLNAWLYLDRMELGRYWPARAPFPWEEFECRIKSGALTLDECTFLPVRTRHAYGIALHPETYLPQIPSITVPQPVAPDLFPLNEPDEDALVLVSANNHLTLDLLVSIWAYGLTPSYLLLVDCSGHTVDMAMIFGTFTSERLVRALGESRLAEKVKHRRLIVPGFTAPLAEGFRRATGWEVIVGPVCAAELPLFLGDRWVPAEETRRYSPSRNGG